MSDSDVKLVKVDNWGIYFLQRLKHFFNRTDYCDLTLQFQDNAQLKVHRLVLSACTEYFELLERTCEMYEDCLVMPDDLQADVVVPIVNFMYTGQLEFRMDLLERLYLTSQIMDMPVLTKLLDAHRQQAMVTPIQRQQATSNVRQNSIKRSYSKSRDHTSASSHSTSVMKTSNSSVVSNSSTTKRQYATAFGNNKSNKTMYAPDLNVNNGTPQPYSSPDLAQSVSNISRKAKLGEPRPTRYELPEELDSDNLFDSSFTNISYTSQPLMVHPETTKYYSPKKSRLFGEPSGSRGAKGETSTLDIVECKKISKTENIFDDDNESVERTDYFHLSNNPSPKASNQLFDQIIDQNDGTKVTIETKDSRQAGNIDHAKIISEVLKKYPHLVKSNKNIKLKILNSPNPSPSKPPSKPKKQTNNTFLKAQDALKSDDGYTYETDVMDSKEAAKLIAMGAENTHGPWICLICGTPGKAIHFTTYYKFRRHLVDVHNEKPVSNMCEYCGLKSSKRNYLLHHLLIKHGVEPPPSYRFPKCNLCNYVALTEGFLVKHKLAHSEAKSFRCNVCPVSYGSSSQLLAHIQTTGHKYTSDSKKPNLQCIYCLKVFLRESNFYAHLKTAHKESAKSDGIIDDSDEERQQQEQEKMGIVKFEPKTDEDEEMETQYQITPDGNIDIIQSRKHVAASTSNPAKQKILNTGFGSDQKQGKKLKPQQTVQEEQEEVVMIDNTEYIMRENQLVPKRTSDNEFNLSDLIQSEENSPSTSMVYSNTQNSLPGENSQQKMGIKKTATINQPIQIVVSNEEEYKALMNSNHSIIFDDGDADKTLTVLSTPHTINTSGLDLDTTQSNEMMIIPENYPLSVSEALPTENSNIVVVYGHSVDEQDKQFQIITSQDIGPQYVQSSAVITQNFETITTASPTIISTPVIDAQITQSWQNNTNNKQQDPQMQELSEITVIQTHHGIDTTANNTLTDLPEVTLTLKAPELVMSENVLQEGLDQSIETTDNINEKSQEERHTEPEVPMDLNDTTDGVEHSTEEVIDNPAVADIPADKTEQMLTINNPLSQDTITSDDKEGEPISIEQPDGEPMSVEQPDTEPISIEQPDREEIDEPAPEKEIGDVVLESTEVTEASNIKEQEQLVSDNFTPVVVETTEAVTEIAKEQIQRLTADWSEDEYDTECTEQVDENIPTNNQESDTNSQDMEESIERIQQEVDKHVNLATVNSENSVENEKVVNTEQPSISLVTEAPQEKISSLLNDWDENDSQEESDAVAGDDQSVAKDGSDKTTNIEISKESDGVEVENGIPKKDDKIQSLVSDWDEDEEDGKN